MASGARHASRAFDPAAFRCFRFLGRELDAHGRVRLSYALDEQLEFVEEFELPLARPLSDEQRAGVDGALSLLHWVAGVSYFKTALPASVAFEGPAPPPAAAALLEALYSEGLAELAYTNRLGSIPRPSFPGASAAPPRPLRVPSPRRVLVPIGGGKDSAVALEIVRRSGLELALFSVGDAPPIVRTVAAAGGLAHLLARRRLDPGLGALNAAGAINGHVPVTAIVSCVAVLTAALNGFDTVAMANERSASSPSLAWAGVEVNHQFSKGLRAERLLQAALAELGVEQRIFSILRPASELSIARAFARLERYHHAFTSCNAIFRIDPALRRASWCCDCPKCRFTFLALAPFMSPGQLRGIFGCEMLDDERQFEGFALLTATGGPKPFECVGEERESIAAICLLADDPRWREQRVVRRLAEEILPRVAADARDAGEVFALRGEHAVPASLMAEVRALLGA